MAGIESTDARWPVLLFRLNESLEIEDYERLFALYELSYARGERFVSIIEGKRVLQVPGPAARKLIAVKAKEHEPHSIRWVAQSTVVVQNGLVRGAVTAITWLSPPVYPLSFEPTLQAAVETVAGALKREGRDLPYAIRDRLLAYG